MEQSLAELGMVLLAAAGIAALAARLWAPSLATRMARRSRDR